MKPVIAITPGDPSGIGAEVTLKALAQETFYDQCIPLVVGDGAVLRDAISFTGSPLRLRPVSEPEEARGRFGTVDLLDQRLLSAGDWTYGRVGRASGEAAFQYIVRAIGLANARRVDAVVTGPINKEAIHLAGHPFSGHTEIFAHYTHTTDYAMLLISGNLRVIHCTTHVSMRQACDMITEKRVGVTIRLAQRAMEAMGMPGGTIGVAGLNAHCSENGLFGTEEADAIIPAIERARAEGLRVEGPVPPDTVFVKALAGQYDIVVAMYHDQGHIPLKLHGFRMDPATGLFSSVSGVNTTIGLPIIRTSVDHGTAFDRAGRNVSNAESMEEALALAVRMALHREGTTA